MKKYFFIDYDNTLFSHRTHQIPDSALKALLSAQKAGHRIFLASGRAFRGDLSEFVGSDFRPDGSVGSNGALVSVGGIMLEENYFDSDIKERLIHFVMEKNYCVIARSEDTWYISNLEHMLANRREEQPLNGAIKSGNDFWDLLDKPVLSFYLEEGEDGIRDLQQHFPELKLLRMGDELGGADIVLQTNGKAAGMRKILDYFGASIEDSVAIGDSMNDLEILKEAALGIAMGNAMPELKEAADYVTDDIDADGLGHAIAYALLDKS